MSDYEIALANYEVGLAKYEILMRDLKRGIRQKVQEARRETQDAFYDFEDDRIEAIEASTDDNEVRQDRLLRLRKAARQVQREMEDKSYDMEEKMLEYLEDLSDDYQADGDHRYRLRKASREHSRAMKKSMDYFEEKFQELMRERPNSRLRGNHTKSPTLEPAVATGSRNRVTTSPPSTCPSPHASVTNSGIDSAVNSESPITQQGPKSPVARKTGLCMPCFKLWRTPIEARVEKVPECVLPEIGSRRKKCEGCVERRTACTMIPPELTERLLKRKESLERSRAKGGDTAHDTMFLEQQYFIVMEKLEKEPVGVVKRKRQRPA
ncbi:hypothetical protein N7504_001483 [Penicillium tannophilum]|nr:hypothetical protein N7504_001483 [Penicillium tannophilum]